MKSKIVSLLRASQDYVSGEALSEALGVTRSAVWKHIKALKSDGYIIDSVRNRGYRLVSEPDLLDADKILPDASENLVIKRIVTMKETDSTNEEAKRRVHSGDEGGVVIAAERQTAGKGRFCRVWESPFRDGLFFSILLKPELPPTDVASITLAAGYAVCLAIRDITGIDARIKWPNDVIVGNRKLCGILTEMSAQSDRIEHLIIGIGINVNNSSFPDEIAKRATSLFIETGKKTDRNFFFSRVLYYLDRAIGGFLVSLSIEDIEHFKEICATMGRTVTVQRGRNTITGIAYDISPEGELIIKTDGGNDIVINSGEVTVQGIY